MMDSSELDKTGQSAENMVDPAEDVVAIEHQHKINAKRNSGVSETKGKLSYFILTTFISITIWSIISYLFT